MGSDRQCCAAVGIAQCPVRHTATHRVLDRPVCGDGADVEWPVLTLHVITQGGCLPQPTDHPDRVYCIDCSRRVSCV